MKRSLLGLLAMIICQLAWAATELAPGVLYQSGSKLLVSSLGLEMTVPEQWQALLPQGSEALVLEATGQPARMIVTAAPQSSEQSIRMAMTQPQAIDMTTSLTPSGDFSQHQGIYHQAFLFQGENPQNLAASALGRLGKTNTAIFVIMLEPEGQGLFPDMGRRFIQAVEFSTPTAASRSTVDSGEQIDWDQQLRGRTLRYLKTEHGLSVDRRMNLCSNGRFFYSDQDSYISSDAVSDFSSIGQSNQAGHWQINDNRLLLTWNDGSKSGFTLTRRYVEDWNEWGTFVDDERWFNVSNEICP